MATKLPNPAQPDETPAQNVRNAMTIIGAIVEVPELFSKEDVMQMLDDAQARLRAAVLQLESKHGKT